MNESPPNSMPANWRRWESILNQSFPDRFIGETTTQAVLEDLGKLGLPIVLDQSAMDDSLVENDRIELERPNQSLGARLKQVLNNHNACILFARERIRIISLDDAEDSEFFMTIIYDVSGMGLNPRYLVDTIQGSIFPDSWQDTGQGLGTIEYLSVRGKDLLVISQMYQAQLDVRILLNGMNRLTGARSVRNQRNPDRFGSQHQFPTGSTSTVIIPRGSVFPSAGN